MVKYYRDNERGNMLPSLNGLLFLDCNKGYFICTIPQTAFATPVVEHWLDVEIAQRVHQMGSIERPPAP